jgi:putative flippase GtrA
MNHAIRRIQNAYRTRQIRKRRMTARQHWRCQIIPFTVVGVIGFAIDAGALTILMSASGLSPYQARAISFPLAVLGTWLINRRWTFRSSQPVRQSIGIEYVRYLFVQSLGAASNLCVFAFALARQPELIRYPVIPLAIGAAVGLAINFVGSRMWVFADRSGRSYADRPTGE